LSVVIVIQVVSMRSCIGNDALGYSNIVS